tara:strand:+ start:8903 stop:9694 length:792 start_codon:yes stop_codon:yes gene_type:complete
MQQEMDLKVQFIEQKNMLRNQLDDIIDEHEDLLDEYGELNQDLQQKDSVIRQQVLEINSLLETKKDLKQAFKKIEVLKTISKKYIDTIDSLINVNNRLRSEKDSVITVNKNINWKNYKLNKQNEKLVETVSKGSILEFERLEVYPIKRKITGKEAITKQAKKTQKLQICFSVLGNSIAESGTKKAYIQIVSQDGLVLKSNSLIQTILELDTVDVTTFTEFDYQNRTIDHCHEWERLNILQEGYYLISVIINEKIVAQTTLKLK